jgi:uncharacterized membrane protein YagU involved in acid resistance
MMRRWLIAGLATAILDGLFSSVLAAFFYGSTFSALWLGVASSIGAKSVAIGLLIHLCVALAWAGVFVIVLEPRTRGINTFVLAAIYGAFVWLTMSLAVIPLLFHRPPSITVRWWIQFFGHMLFVGLPIVALGRRNADARLSSRPAAA